MSNALANATLKGNDKSTSSSQGATNKDCQLAPIYNVISKSTLPQCGRLAPEMHYAGKENELTKRQLGQLARHERERSKHYAPVQPRFFPSLPPSRRRRACLERESNKRSRLQRMTYENWVKIQMGIGAKESERESLNEFPSSVLPDVYDELATSESVSYKEIDPQIRKPVYSKELAVASKNLQKTQLGIGGASESGSESVNESFSSVLDKSTEDVNEEGVNGEGSLMGKVLLASSCEDDNFLLRLGPVIIDNHGFILGEFSWLDDLWICDNEDAN